MHALMEKFQDYREEELPRVIGLTGMLTSDSVKPMNVEDDLNKLEATFRSAITTVKGLDALSDVLLYSTAPKESYVLYDDFKLAVSLEKIQILIEEVIVPQIKAWPIDMTHDRRNKMELQEDGTPNPKKKLISLWRDFVYQMRDFGEFRFSTKV